ncbi:NAD(P)H-dependent oxidoreductase [Nissabacter sp. SGAir0207]|uniref:NAD(P)H-dependent oxidoreductase n=1 Tax=Nissabacter sp. SGAir0207 TaxID=2126321 RepID=UPI0010CCD20F|nr:NAD(P)H-dependent oxidoreductase [Nissabacter sp. SGAir0207]QCR38825.1 NAD(P)H dehydrogenase [Nissabacter sp. SGAir0207]
MHALIVSAHPDGNSHTQAVAAHVASGIQAGGIHSVEQINLADEQFDPRFNQADYAQFSQRAALPADVVAEQARLDRANALVLVYPIYWWSFPAQLKGWIDRVFTQDWAYYEDGDRVTGKLGHLQVHLLALGAASPRTYVRHGYFSSMRTQIDHGIFDYCGAPVMTSELLLPSDEHFPDAHYRLAHNLGRQLFNTKEPA